MFSSHVISEYPEDALCLTIDYRGCVVLRIGVLKFHGFCPRLDHNIPQNSLVIKFTNICVVMTQYQELNPAMLLLWQCYLDDRLTVPTQAVKQTLQS